MKKHPAHRPYRLTILPLLALLCGGCALSRHAAGQPRYVVAHTSEAHLQAGAPVCYLDEEGDTIVPYGKYLFCQTDTIRTMGFAYELSASRRIACLNRQGQVLCYAWPCDNGPDPLCDGRFRIIDGQGRIGFADGRGRVVIRPQYRFASPFSGGLAQATMEGTLQRDGEHATWLSDNWLLIDLQGRTRLQYAIVRRATGAPLLRITPYRQRKRPGRPFTYTLPATYGQRDCRVCVSLEDADGDGHADLVISGRQPGHLSPPTARHALVGAENKKLSRR